MAPPAAWSEGLDALEEWLRHLRAGLRRLELPGPPPPLPEGDLPPHFRLRALTLQAQLTAAEISWQQRHEQLQREAAYGGVPRS